MSCCSAPGTKQTEPQKPCCPGGDSSQNVQDSVKQYYGKELNTKDDIKTGVNCQMDLQMPKHVRQALGEVHDDVTIKYYGCGLVIPEAVEGCSVLDLGSGSGRDCFALSKLVGASGKVVGVDMTEEQLAVARKHVDYHTEKFGYTEPNVEFVTGYIEKLGEAGLKDNTFDVIVSNCVVNLSPDKTAVLKEAHRVLKEGGELYFSDIYTNTHLSDSIRKHRVLWGECISGALQWEELYSTAKQVGFSQPRLVSGKMVDVSKFKDVLGDDAKFVSVTYRLFKLPSTLKSATKVTYKGGILGSCDELEFDHAVTFKKGEGKVVDAELATILSASRFQTFFAFENAGDATPVTSAPRIDPFKYVEDHGSSSIPCCCD
ncbi:arsenite methyltransferase-like [Littorina saxatilis]|uniref:Arsenite methyltransferase n=1 Tax=Littorina saxatilis TaxID=31220 RepID=A0AAN9ARR9_9CAEN